MLRLCFSCLNFAEAKRLRLGAGQQSGVPRVWLKFRVSLPATCLEVSVAAPSVISAVSFVPPPAVTPRVPCAAGIQPLQYPSYDSSNKLRSPTKLDAQISNAAVVEAGSKAPSALRFPQILFCACLHLARLLTRGCIHHRVAIR